MKVNKKELLKALKAVMPGVADKTKVEQDTAVVFMDNRVITFNDDISVSYPIKIDLEGAIPAKDFEKFVSKLKGDEIELVLKEGCLKVNDTKSKVSKGAKAGIRLEPEIVLPVDAIGTPKKWTDIPEKFCAAIKFCLFTVSRDETSILNSIHVLKDRVTSSDNQRITRYHMGKGADKAFPEDLLIPSAAAKHVITYDPVEYGLTDGWIHFRNEAGVVFACRFFDDEWPDDEFTDLLECQGDEVTFPDGLAEVLDRADVFSDGERVGIILDDGNLTVTTENSSGWFEEECEVKFDGGLVEFDIQPAYMKEIIKINNTATIGEATLKFEGDDFEHSVRLMNPKAK